MAEPTSDVSLTASTQLISVSRCRAIILPGAPIMFIGEAPGEQEELLGQPFVGAAGQELGSLCVDAGIDKSACSISSLFDERPPENKLDHWFVPRNAAGPFPAYGPGKYFDPERVGPALARLRAEIEAAKPNLLVALGGTALWALFGTAAIGKYRGVILQAHEAAPKFIATYHPAALFRNWALRVIVVSDLIKARRESLFSDIRRPRRELWLEPTLDDLTTFEAGHIETAAALAVDIETHKGQITCIGFAPSADRCIVVPFVDWRKPDYNYWTDLESERAARLWCRKQLRRPIEKIFQNGIYDTQYLVRERMPPFAWRRDTMLKHHALYMELEKDLGFLGSVYTDEAAWKALRPRGAEHLKKEE